MKKSLIALAGALAGATMLVAAAPASAHDRFAFGVSVGVPVAYVAPAPYYAPAPGPVVVGGPAYYGGGPVYYNAPGYGYRGSYDMYDRRDPNFHVN